MKTRLQNKFTILLSGLLLLVLPITFSLPTCYSAPAYAAKEDSATVLEQQAETLAQTKSTIARGTVSWDKLKPAIESYLGTPYKWGGKSPKGWDCSGFVWWVLHKHYNVTAKGEGTSHLMSHYNSSAYRVYDSRTSGLNYSSAVSKGIIHPGDIIVFLDPSGVDVHTAIAGDGTYIYHAWSEYYGTCKTKFEKVWAEDGINHRGFKADPNIPSHLNERSRGHNATAYGSGTYANFVVFRGLSQGGIIDFTKASANLSTTDKNPHYSLKGAVYQVKNSQNKVVATLTTDEHGRAKTGRLPFDTYTVKETKASPGYALDTKTYTVKLSSSDHAVNGIPTHNLLVKEQPQLYRESAHALLSINKLDGETNSQKPQGETTLEGAVFEIKHYAINAVKSVNELEGLKPTKTWKVTTNAEGTASIVPSKQEGTSLAGIPLGVLTIQEVSAPRGYLINNEKVLVNLTKNGQEQYIPFKQPFAIKDNPIRGDFMLLKTDEADRPLQNAIFTITSEATGYYLTLKTDENGYATTQGMKLLPPDKKPTEPTDQTSPIDPMKPTDQERPTALKDNFIDQSESAPKSQPASEATPEDEQQKPGEQNRGALPYGTYIVHEETPPEGYLSIEDFNITIDRDQQFVFIQLKDKRIPEPESKPEPEPESKPEPESEPQPEPKPEVQPEAKPKPESKPLLRLPSTGDNLPACIGSLVNIISHFEIPNGLLLNETTCHSSDNR